MRFRDLIGKDGERVWPPAWGATHGLRDTEGVLADVRRIGRRLSITIRVKRHQYVALLDEWQEPLHSTNWKPLFESS